MTITAPDGRFFGAVMTESRRRILLVHEGIAGESGEATAINYLGLTFDGDTLRGPCLSDFPLRLSPDGRYFVGTLDPGAYSTAPVLYDSAGTKLKRFGISSGDWDLRFVNDTTLLLRDSRLLRQMTFPTFHQTDSMTLEPFTLGSRTNQVLSADGNLYVFQSASDIIGVDLKTRATTQIEKPVKRTLYLTPDLLLSHEGAVLMTVHSRDGAQYADLYGYWDDDFHAIDTAFQLPIRNGSFWRDFSYIRDHIVVATFFVEQDETFIFRSFLLDLDANELSLRGGIIFDGLVLPTDTAGVYTAMKFRHHSAEIGQLNLTRIR